MTKPLAMTELTWQEYALQGPETIVTLCVGSVEQHGPHLPLSVDLLIPYNLSLLLSQQVPLIVAPPLHYGYRSQPATGGGQGFPGTTSLSGETLINLTKDILLDFIRQGRTRFLIMNGHFENTAFVAEAGHQVTSLHPGVKVVIANWWELVEESTLDDLFPLGFPGWEVEHASVVETSLILHFCPDLVHMDRVPGQQGKKHKPRPLVFPEPQGLVPPSGILYTAEGASSEIGKTIAQELEEKLIAIVKEQFSL